MYYFENIDNASVINRIPTKPTRIQGDLVFDEVIDADKPLVDQTISYYNETLLSSQRATDFLDGRGLNDPEIISAFRLGFSDRSIGFRLTAAGSDQEAIARGALQRVGLLKPSGHEFFRGALVFPFIDKAGNITGAYGRRITPKLKAHSVYHLHWVTPEALFFNEQALEQSK